MKLDVPRSEWIRIVLVIFIFSILSAWLNAAYNFEGNADFVEDFLHSLLLVCPIFLITCIPFHLYARQQNWSDEKEYRRNRYVNAGCLLGALAGVVLAAVNVYILWKEPFVDGVIFLLGGIFYGSIAGTLCSYSFFAFGVSDQKKYKILVIVLWLVLLLPAVFHNLISWNFPFKASPS